MKSMYVGERGCLHHRASVWRASDGLSRASASPRGGCSDVDGARVPGVLASLTTLPVIGVPLAATPLAGFDSLLSIVQMPPGIPVATVAVGPMGARNAGHLAAEIIGLFDEEVATRIKEQRVRMRASVQLPEGFTFE